MSAKTDLRLGLSPAVAAAAFGMSARGWRKLVGEGRAPAMYANTDQGSVPVVTVARGERRTVDLYFPLPGPVRGPESLAAFDLKWQIQTGARLVAERTPFSRLEIRETVAPHPHAAVFIGWGPFWWLHPHHSHFYVHAPIVVVQRPHRRVVIVRQPRRVYVAPPADRTPRKGIHPAPPERRAE